MKRINFVSKQFFFIIKKTCIVIMLIGCGYQSSIDTIQKKIDNINYTKLTVLLYSYDPFNAITRAVKQELYLNHINIINDLYNINDRQNALYLPCIDILDTIKKRVTISVFPDGHIAEYQLIVQIQSRLFIPNKKKYYPININIRRTFLKNPGEALSNNIQEHEILEDIYQDAAQQLIQKFLIQLKINKKEIFNKKNYKIN